MAVTVKVFIRWRIKKQNSTKRQVWTGRQQVPAQTQVPVVVSGCLGSLHKHRAFLIGCWRSRWALLCFPLPAGVFCSLLGRVAGAGRILLRRLPATRLLPVLLPLSTFLTSSPAGCYCFAWSFFVFGNWTTCLRKGNNALSEVWYN